MAEGAMNETFVIRTVSFDNEGNADVELRRDGEKSVWLHTISAEYLWQANVVPEVMDRVELEDFAYANPFRGITLIRPDGMRTVLHRYTDKEFTEVRRTFWEGLLAALNG